MTGGIYVSSSGKSAGVMSAELGMSILANATVAVCSTGGLSKEDCAQLLVNAARFIGVSTGSFLVSARTDLTKLISDLESQILQFSPKGPANTGGPLDEYSKYIEEQKKRLQEIIKLPGQREPRTYDWRFYGKNGDEDPSWENYWDSYTWTYGENIITNEMRDKVKPETATNNDFLNDPSQWDFRQRDVDVNIKERLTTILMHEDPTSENGRKAIALSILNRMLNPAGGYTDPDMDKSLYSVLIASAKFPDKHSDQYGVYQTYFNKNMLTQQTVDPYNLNAYIKEQKSKGNDNLEEAYKQSSELAEKMISICGNKDLSVDEKYNLFSDWIGITIPQTSQGRHVPIKLVTSYVGGESNDVYYVDIEGSDNHFSVDTRDYDFSDSFTNNTFEKYVYRG